MQLIRVFSLLWAASSPSSFSPLLLGEGHCSMLPSPWRPDPSTQPLVIRQGPLCCSKATKTPNYLVNSLSPGRWQEYQDSLPVLCILFVFQSTDWLDLNWWWRGGREGDLFFLDRKPVLSCALLIVLAQPELSSYGVWGTSCWSVSLLMSPSNSRVFFPHQQEEQLKFSVQMLSHLLFFYFILLGESWWRKQMTWAQDAVQGLKRNKIWFWKDKMFWLPWWNKLLSMDLLCSRNGTSC